MIDFVKRFWQINGTNIGSVSTINNVFHSTACSTNSIITSYTLFKPKLIISGLYRNTLIFLLIFEMCCRTPCASSILLASVRTCVCVCVVACRRGYFRCVAGGSCLASYRRCNGRCDCPYCTDELNCYTPPSYSTITPPWQTVTWYPSYTTTRPPPLPPFPPFTTTYRPYSKLLTYTRLTV